MLPPICQFSVSAAILFATLASSATRADDAAPEWLRGAGSKLEIRLRGEILDADGQPARDPRIACRMISTEQVPKLEPTLDGHRFEVWIPVNSVSSFSVGLDAASANDNRVAHQQLNAYQLRQAAIDGLKLSLSTPTKEKRFLVQHDGKPVEGAAVKVEFSYLVEARATTDAQGVARFELLPQQEITRVTAWTNDRRMGGFSFDREPTHDPSDDEFIVELSQCRDQRLRFVDERGAPVADVEATVQIATAPPSYNFLGTNENSRIRASAAGEVVYPWFPDWKEHHFYVDLNSRGWIITGDPERDGDAYIIRLQKSTPRHRVTGKLATSATDPGGFFVAMHSFQGEREQYSDQQSTFTDADGSFTLDILPDATYCAWVLDSNWVSEITDLVPYDSELKHESSPTLTIKPGQKVDIIATVGPQQQPYGNLPLYFRREHHVEWRGADGKQTGLGGPQWWATTDALGRASTFTAPGKLNVNVYTPKWRDEQAVDVRAGEPTTVTLHREVADRKTVRGRVVAESANEIRWQDLELQASAVDGHYNDKQQPVCEPDGTFTFDTLASAVGIFAATADGKLAGSVVARDFDALLEVKLHPTLAYDGQLLGPGRQPLADHRVLALVRVGSDRGSASPFLQFFDVRRREVRTDDSGNFTLTGLPANTLVSIYADAIDASSELAWVEEVLLQPGDSRPRTVSHLRGSANGDDATPLAQRYTTTLRDCRLGGWIPLVILHGGGPATGEFVDRSFVDHQENRAVAGFMPILVDTSADALTPADASFLKEHDWRPPGEGEIVVLALDTKGGETARLELDVRDAAAATAATEFVSLHAPPQQDAEAKWRHAFDDARDSNRRVLARVSQRYCGPCFLLSRWLDDHHELLEKDYVLLKIDNVRDLHGREVAQRLTRGEHHGVPFFAIFDADEKLLVDSAGPLDNIGYPGGRVESQRHLRQMLESTRTNLSDAQIGDLIDSLSN